MKVILQNNEEDCLLACYTMLLNDLGYKIPLYEVYERDSIPADGLSVSYLSTLNQRFKVEIKAYKADINALYVLSDHVQSRIILHWNNDHFVVLEKLSPKFIQIVDPALGRIKYTRKEFLEHYTGTAILVNKTENFKSKNINTLFWKHFKNTINIKSVFFFVLSLIMIEASILLFSILIRNIMAEEIRLYASLMLLICIIVFQLIGYYIKNLTLSRYNKDFDKSYTYLLFERLLDKPLLYFRNHSTGSISEKINFRTILRDSVASKIIPSIVSFVSAIVIFIYLATISFWLSIILLSMIFIYIIFSTILYKRENEYNQSYLQYLIDFNSEFQSELENIDYIKVMRQEKIVESRWRDNNEHLTDKYSQIITIENVIQAFSGIFNYFTLSIIILLAIYYNDFFALSIADLVLFQTSVSLLISSMEQLKASVFEISRLAVYAEKQGDLLKTNDPIKIGFDPNSRYIIQTRNLNFSYGNKPLYKDINLKIEKGEKVAIVGKSGSGKSTLLLLLTGMLRYTGRIIYNDKNPEEGMGVVLQNMTLKKGSVLENLEYKSSDLSRVTKVLVDTTADDVIAKLPNNLNSKLLKQGKNLSGGQIQKLLIARSLLNGEKIVLWDEAFSNLDELSKNSIYVNVLQNDYYREQSILIVSHHLDIVDYVDSVIFINDKTGEVIKSTHDNLLKTNSDYRDFIKYKASADFLNQ